MITERCQTLAGDNTAATVNATGAHQHADPSDIATSTIAAMVATAAGTTNLSSGQRDASYAWG